MTATCTVLREDAKASATRGVTLAADAGWLAIVLECLAEADGSMAARMEAPAGARPLASRTVFPNHSYKSGDAHHQQGSGRHSQAGS